MALNGSADCKLASAYNRVSDKAFVYKNYIKSHGTNGENQD